MTSSPHGPYVLGYTRATMVSTTGSKTATLSKSLKDTSVRIALCNSVHEAGITSNRGSACHGECVPGSCTHRPSHHGSWFYLKARFQTLDHGIVSDWGEVVTR